MKASISFVTVVILGIAFTGNVWGQSPEKLSYQAILRNSNNELIKDQEIGMRISILQGTPDGAAVYMETQTPVTNGKGLITIKIGEGNVESGDFSSIDWSAGPYFLKTEADPDGGTNYSITGTIQLLSVPYALYANKAGNAFSGDYNDLTNTPDLSGYITTENDPVFTASPANGITGTDITNWNNKLDNYTETDPLFSNSVAHGITQNDTSYWNNKLSSYNETDPRFSVSPANGITNTDITNWNNKLDSYTETDPVFSNSVAQGITQNDTSSWNNKLDSYSETDPVFTASPANNITPADTTKWSTAYNWGNHAEAGYDTSLDNWTGDTATYTMGNIGIKTLPTQINLQIGTPQDNFFARSFQDIDTSKDRTLMLSGLWDAGTHSKSIIYLGGNWVNPDEITGGLTFASGAYENAAIQGREGHNTDWSGELVFLTRQDENLMTEKMRITENGNVGIGTTTPSSKLTVNGTIETTVGGVKFPDGTEQTTAAPQHYVGEFYGGGIVVYVYDNGRHGLIASLDDLDGGNGAEWGLSGTDVPDCESAWDGASNTAAIIAAGGAATEAAGLCDNYAGGGYTDWYLPATWELNILYLNAFVISKILETDGDSTTHGLKNDERYWSSTEVDDAYAVPLFGYDNTDNYLKTNTYEVRAIRSF